MRKLNYKDTVTLIQTEVNGWGTEIPVETNSVKALFVSNIGFSHSANQDSVTSNATCYLDINNKYIQDNFNRLEGMFLIFKAYGDQYPYSWYKITNVAVGQDKLLSNKIDNIEVNLKKTTELKYVS